MKEGERRQMLRTWLAVVGSATLVLGASFALVYQSARFDAKEAPLAAAQNAKKMLADDATPNEVVPEEEVDLRESSGLFVIITDSNKKVLASSAVLDGEAPLPAPKIFEYAERNNSDSFTWEPKEGVRLATQILKYDENNGGYIVAGQSLQQLDEQADRLARIAILAWLAIVIWTIALLLPPARLSRSKK